MTDQKWRLAPVEATPEQLEAGKAHFGEVNSLIAYASARVGSSGLSKDPLPAAYRAMLEASPSVEGFREKMIAAIEQNVFADRVYTGAQFEDCVTGAPEAADAILAMFQGAAQSQPSASSNGRTEAEPSASFQARVRPWMLACFGPVIPFDKEERGDRLIEEVFELLQSGGYDPARVLALRDYVWGRPVGEPSQEVGGVMVTLAAYCNAFELDMAEAGETELARIWTKVEAIRAKQAAKPTGSALPIAVETPATRGEAS